MDIVKWVIAFRFSFLLRNCLLWYILNCAITQHILDQRFVDYNLIFWNFRHRKSYKSIWRLFLRSFDRNGSSRQDALRRASESAPRHWRNLFQSGFFSRSRYAQFWCMYLRHEHEWSTRKVPISHCPEDGPCPKPHILHFMILQPELLSIATVKNSPAVCSMSRMKSTTARPGRISISGKRPSSSAIHDHELRAGAMLAGRHSNLKPAWVKI